MGAAGAAVARARRRVISHFMRANAVSTATALPFTPAGLVERRQFERLLQAGVIQPGGDGYYLDVPRYDSWSNRRNRRVGLVMAGLALAGTAIVALMG